MKLLQLRMYHKYLFISESECKYSYSLLYLTLKQPKKFDFSLVHTMIHLYHDSNDSLYSAHIHSHWYRILFYVKIASVSVFPVLPSFLPDLPAGPGPSKPETVVGLADIVGFKEVVGVDEGREDEEGDNEVEGDSVGVIFRIFT